MQQKLVGSPLHIKPHDIMYMSPALSLMLKLMH